MNSKWMMYRRSVISPEQHQILQHFYDVGMTNQSVQCFGLIMDCSQQTGLDYNVVRAWIGNKRRKLMQEAVKGMKADEQLHPGEQHPHQPHHHQHHHQHHPSHHPPGLGRAVVKTEPSLSPVPAGIALASPPPSPMQLPQSRQQHLAQGSPLARILPKPPIAQLSQSCQSKLMAVGAARMGGATPAVAVPGGAADRGGFHHAGHVQRLVAHGQGSGGGQICRSGKVEVPLQSRPSKVYPSGFLDQSNSQRIRFPGVQPKVEQLTESVSSPRQWSAELLGGRNSEPREPGQAKLSGAMAYGPYDLEIQNVVSLGAGPSTSKAASSYYKQEVQQPKLSANSSTSGNGNSFSIAMETGDLDEYSREEEMAQAGCQLQESFMEYIDLEEDDDEEDEEEDGDPGPEELDDKRNGNDAGDDTKLEPGDDGLGGVGGVGLSGGAVGLGGGGSAETGDAGTRVQPFSPAQDRVVRAAKSLVCLSESVSRIGSPSVHAAKSDGVAVSGSTPHQSMSPITSFTQGFLPIGTQSPGQHQPYLLNVGLGGMPYLSSGRKRVMQDRTQFSPRDLVMLKRYWDNGMTSLGTVCREKIESVANELNIDFEIVKNWIGNQRRRCRQQGMEPPQPRGGPPDFPRDPKETQGSHHHIAEIASQYLGRGMQDISLDGHGRQGCDATQSPGSQEDGCYDIDGNGIASGLRGHDPDDDAGGDLIGDLDDGDSNSMDAQHLEHTQGETMFGAGRDGGGGGGGGGGRLDNDSCGSSDGREATSLGDRNHLPVPSAYRVGARERDGGGYRERSPQRAGGDSDDDTRSRCRDDDEEEEEAEEEEDQYSPQKVSAMEELQAEVQRQREENMFLRRLLTDVAAHVQDGDWHGLQNLVASLPDHTAFTAGEESSSVEHPPTGKAACENVVASLSEELSFERREGIAPRGQSPPSDETREQPDASPSEKDDGSSVTEQGLPDDAAEKESHEVSHNDQGSLTPGEISAAEPELTT